MIPVDQTRFGVPGGNCFSACVASILEMPIEAVPYFMDPGPWYIRFEDWLRSRGLYPMTFVLPSGWAPPVGMHVILGGKSPRGDHAVVGRVRSRTVEFERGTERFTVTAEYETVHDPHPSRDGLIRIEDVTVLAPIVIASRHT